MNYGGLGSTIARELAKTFDSNGALPEISLVSSDRYFLFNSSRNFVDNR